MIRMVTVSAILPTYNPNKEWLETAIRSVLNQSFEDIELILIDDESPEPIHTLISKEILADDRIKIHRIDNSGFTAATNEAIRQSQGEYIAPIGQDDIWREDKLKKQLQQITNKDMVFSKAYRVSEDGDCFGTYGEFPNKQRFHKLIVRCYPCYESVLIRKSVFKEQGLLNEDYDIVSDWEFWLRTWPYVTVGYVDRPLLSKRFHTDNTSRDMLNLRRENKQLREMYLEEYNASRAVRRKVKSHFHLHAGIKYFEKDDIERARKSWKTSISACPYDVRPYILFLASYSDRFFERIISVYYRS